MNYVFEIIDKTEKKIHLTKERWSHILKHPKMDENQLEIIQETLRKPLTIRYSPQDEGVRYFYKQIKSNSQDEKYLFVSVKYLNGDGFVITSFFTNKITGEKWKAK